MELIDYLVAKYPHKRFEQRGTWIVVLNDSGVAIHNPLKQVNLMGLDRVDAEEIVQYNSDTI